MHDVTRRRLWRKLEALPDDQLYQVLDFIEFLESKYAPGRAPEPRGFQRFAERLEDGMRARAVTPRVMRRAVGWLDAAGRMLGGVADAGRGLLRELDAGTRPARPDAPEAYGAAEDAGTSVRGREREASRSAATPAVGASQAPDAPETTTRLA